MWCIRGFREGVVLRVAALRGEAASVFWLVDLGVLLRAAEGAQERCVPRLDGGGNEGFGEERSVCRQARTDNGGRHLNRGPVQCG